MTIIPPYPSEVTSKPKTRSIPILSKIPWIAVALAQSSFRIARWLRLQSSHLFTNLITLSQIFSDLLLAKNDTGIVSKSFLLEENHHLANDERKLEINQNKLPVKEIDNQSILVLIIKNNY
ncbi:hypothetical protein BpHYR1_016145 [Brachionus plicatilis]|uniref:Uncharacterized protein n=1 Tax=Brachionus plicatilis TaxID=10195 RepID=A0A3M7RPE2_BRAPC|nr:hypothetical protein BpHYR1_016145 [Brachionus plicatilis]